jgi:hypothetical protein
MKLALTVGVLVLLGEVHWAFSMAGLLLTFVWFFGQQTPTQVKRDLRLMGRNRSTIVGENQWGPTPKVAPPLTPLTMEQFRELAKNQVRTRDLA